MLIKGGLGKGFMEEKGLGEGKGIQERGDKFSTSNETVFKNIMFWRTSSSLTYLNHSIVEWQLLL